MNTEKIYALTLHGDFIYVGRSVNVRDRVHAHRARGIQFDSVVTLAEVPTEDSEQVEAAAIKALAPSENRQLHGGGTHSAFKGHAILSIRISPRVRAQLAEMATRQHRKLSEMARLLIEAKITAREEAA